MKPCKYSGTGTCPAKGAGALACAHYQCPCGPPKPDNLKDEVWQRAI